MKPLLIRSFAAAFFISVLCLLYGFFVEPKMMKTRTIDIDAAVSAPIKIALISDIHIGGVHMPAKRVTKIVQAVNAQKPDIVLIAGDFVDGHQTREEHSDDFNTVLEEGLMALGGLSAPQGIYAALGNHDAWYSLSFMKMTLSKAGLTVLVNEAVHTEGVCVVGIADADTGVEDAAAFDDCQVDHSVIAVMHSPDSFKYLPADIAFAVAGHTHGGQINLPLIGRAVTSTSLGKPYAYGRQDWKTVPIFVTAGLGTSVMPARFRAPPEIVIITLSPH